GLDAEVEFLELRLYELPSSIVLADRPGAARPSPLAGPVVLTKSDAEGALKQAEAEATRARKRRDAARAAVEAIEARVAAEQAHFAQPPDAARQKALALAAGKAERRAAAL